MTLFGMSVERLCPTLSTSTPACDSRGTGLENLLLVNFSTPLKKRFGEIDFREAADEVRVFLHDLQEVELWSKEFFVDLANRIPTG